jgi:hypothetical protein
MKYTTLLSSLHRVVNRDVSPSEPNCHLTKRMLGLSPFFCFEQKIFSSSYPTRIEENSETGLLLENITIQYSSF